MKRLVAGLSIALVACVDNLSGVSSAPDPVSTTTIAPVTFDAIYVVNSESPSVSVINGETNTIASTITIGGAAYPRHVTMSPDGSRLAIAIPGFDMSGGEYGHEHHASRPGRVLLVDPVTGALAGTKATDAANFNVVFAPDGAVWTSQATVPGSTLVLDGKSLVVNAAISVGTTPAEMAVAQTGGFAFVPNSGSATVSVIDMASRAVRTTITVGAGPISATPAANGMVYVVNEPDQSISVIDQSKLAVVSTISLDYRPGSVVLAPSGELWITAPTRSLVELRSTTGAVLKTIETGLGALDVVFSGDGTHAYVSNELEDTVAVIDRASSRVTTKISVGSKPNGMVWRSR